jgi:hypothetical protein
LSNEFSQIGQQKAKSEIVVNKDKKKKIRKKQIIVNIVENV